MKYLTAIFALAFMLTSCAKDDDTTEPDISIDPETEDAGTFTLTSPAIADGQLLSDYQCEDKVDDTEKSIPLAWTNVPENTVSLAITMVHYPNADDLTQPNCYLVLWNIDPTASEIAHGAGDDGPWLIGSNKDETGISYTSPCSPSSGSHEYTITITALSALPGSLPTENSEAVTYDVLQTAISSVEVLGSANLTFDSVTE